MPIKQFYLCGPYASTAVGNIDLDSRLDLLKIQKAVAAHFSIVDPRGVYFWLNAETEIERSSTGYTARQILAATQPIGVLVNGQPVRDAPGPKGLPLLGSHCEVYPDHIGNHDRLFA